MQPLRPLAALVLLAATLSPLSAQQPAPLTGSIASHPDWPTANPTDVHSPDALLNALYDTLSGPAGHVRDWQRFRSLFLPDAQLIPIRPLPGNRNDAVILTPDAYVERARLTMAREGFFERGVHLQTERLGPMLHAWSTYESRHSPADPKPFARGINSVQILEDHGRFWIVNLVWDAETPTTPIPPEYLPSSAAGATTRGEPNSPFTGRWVGTLEHRDRSNNPSSTPVWLTMSPSPDGNSITFAYTFDDGVRKTIDEHTVLTFAPAYSMATLTSPTLAGSSPYRVDGLSTFRTNGRGTLTLLGAETELSRRVESRITITLDARLFSWRKEVRLPGHPDFTLRDSYTLTRETT